MQLAITVHFHHEDLVIVLYKLIHFWREGDREYAHKISLDAVFFFELNASLIDCRFGGAVCHDSYFCSLGRMHNWFGHVLLGSLKFLFEALHIAVEDSGIFSIFGVFIMTRSACEVRTQRMFIAWECAVGNPITIFIEVTSPI